MLDTDEKIAKFFFIFGLILALGAMVLGPLDIRSWSIACGVTASFVALAGMFFALQSWNEPDDVPKEQTPVMAPSLPVEQFVPMTEPHDDGANGETAGEAEGPEQPVE